MSFKIFKNKITKSTTVDLTILISRIKLELVKSGYYIVSESKNSIEFKENIWRLGYRSEVSKRFNRGKFEILSGEGRLIIFSYETYSSYEIIVLLVLLISCILVDYYILLLILFFSLIFLSKVVNLKELADEMLEKIASNNLQEN